MCWWPRLFRRGSYRSQVFRQRGEEEVPGVVVQGGRLGEQQTVLLGKWERLG